MIKIDNKKCLPNNYFHIFLNNLVKKGNKEKALKILFNMLKKLKFKTKKDPLSLLELILYKNEKKIQLDISNLDDIKRLEKKKIKIKNSKLKKKYIRPKGFITYVHGIRLKRKSLKDFLKISREHNGVKSFKNKIYFEFLLSVFNKGLTYKKKREYFNDIKKLRPSLKLTKKRSNARRKRIKLY
jgi:ribosomal protein S7